MKNIKHISVATLLALSLGLGLVSTAGADHKSNTNVTTTSAAKDYHARLRVWLHAKAVIFATFAAAKANARVTFTTAIAANPGKIGIAARLAARTTYKVALSAALAARKSALKGLGPRPTPPGHMTTTTV